MKRFFLFTYILFLFIHLWAQAPAGYYDAIDGKKKEELKTAVHEAIRQYVSLGFDSYPAQFWGDVYFKHTDWHPDGYYWDMYSDKKPVVYNSSNMDREHCMPRSWWKEGSAYGDANNDLLNLYPSDAVANGRKSNYPLGKVDNPTWTNDVSKLGQNVYGSYKGTVFEPADEYKGDFARTYFYMVTCYEDYANRWTGDGVSSMLVNETYPVFQEWAQEMLLEWHRNDPVDQKEIDRNNNVFSIQFNRNPFIDFPDLIEYIWGDKREESFSVDNKATAPTLLSPDANTFVNFGNRIDVPKYILVQGALLTLPVSVELLSGDVGKFTLSQTEIAPDEIINGYRLALTYTPDAEEYETHTAVLRFSSSEVGNVDVTITGNNERSPGITPYAKPTEDMDIIIFEELPWDATNLSSHFETNIVVSSSETVYANGELHFKKSGRYLIAKFDEEPEIMQFALRPYSTWVGHDNHMYVYESTDGTNWGEPIFDVDNGMMDQNYYYNTPEIPLNSSTRAVKIEYLKESQNVGLASLLITRPSGSAISHEAENSISCYGRSSEILISGVSPNMNIEIYSISGTCLYKVIAKQNELNIPITNEGIYIVRVGDKVFKVNVIR